MRKLSVFNSISLDGFFVDAHNEISWAHKNDEEWTAFVGANAAGGGTLLFGRITYEMMASFWPTPMAAETMPKVAEQMNTLPKVVFSRSLKEATWQNTRLVKTDIAAEVRRMKEEPGEGMVILGSGSIVSQLTQGRLIDEYQIALCPVVLGQGRTMFEGFEGKLDLRLTEQRVFRNGTIFLRYQSTS